MADASDPRLHRELIREIENDYLMAEAKMAHYFRCVWGILNPGVPLSWNWHIDLICEHLEAVELEQIRRLIINIPPRNVKSSLVTVAYPTWAWTRKPERRFLASSYAQSLSTKHSVDRRSIIESEWYQFGFGSRFELASDQNVKTEFLNTKRGHMIATSMTGTATGKGCDVLLIDDPQNPKEAHSETARSTVNRTYDTTFPSRLDDKKKGAIIVVMQRLHEDDLTGHVLGKGEDDWVHLKISAEARESKTYSFPVTGTTYERARGEVLHEERESIKELETARKDLGTSGFEAQYNQDPKPSEGNLLKRQWLQFYKQAPTDLDFVFQSWDMAFSGTKESSYVVGQVWGAKGSDAYLLDQVRRQMDFTETLKALLTLTARWPKAHTKLIENKANGPAIVSMIKKKVMGVKEINPKGSKEARFSSVLPMWESGNVWLPDPSICALVSEAGMMKPWVEVYIEELVAFPDCKHKDQVDTTSQALDHLGETTTSYLDKLVTL